MTCRQLAEFLLDYSTGDLAPPARLAFEWHLGRCENCREYLAQYLATVDLARHAFDDEQESASLRGMPEELVVAILAARSQT